MYNEALSRIFLSVAGVMGENKIVKTKDLAYRFVKILSTISDVSFALPILYIFTYTKFFQFVYMLHADFSTFIFLKP